MRITRRGLIKTAGFGLIAGTGLAAYGFGIEPLLRLRIQRYALAPKAWPAGFKLRIAALADIHAGEPYMSAARISRIAEAASALHADVIVLLGDYTAGHRYVSRVVPEEEWAKALSRATAPLGIFAVLGNHDWWDDAKAQKSGKGPTRSRLALEKMGIAVLENDAVRLMKDGQAFWLCGLADQIAFMFAPWRRRGERMGLDDLAGTLAKTAPGEPVVMLAHEPDIFARMPSRVAVTLSGHTHGGQVRLFGWSPFIPSAFGNRYAYGHIVEEDRHLVVSGGLGMSLFPVRFGVPPEIVVVDLS